MAKGLVLYTDIGKKTRGDESENISCKMQNMNQVGRLFGASVNDFDVEEDYYEDEDSDLEYVKIQKSELHVTGEPDFDFGRTQDGQEYLRWVRWIISLLYRLVLMQPTST